MGKNRVPGIYFEDRVSTRRNIGLGVTGVPAFLGVAQRGPLNDAVRVRSYADFLRMYGDPIDGSYLHDSVYGFFANGGEFCFIVRIAHIFRNGDGELARKARYELLDYAGYPTLEVEASSEGRWGNEIKVSVERPEKPRVHSFLAFDVPQGRRIATLQSSRGVERGMLLKLSDGENERYVTVVRIRGNDIYWKEELDIGFKSGAPTYVESMEFTLLVEDKQRKERFIGLSLSDASGRNVSRVVSSESEMVRVRVIPGMSETHMAYPEDIVGIDLRGGRDGLGGITPEDILGLNNGPGERYGLGMLEANEEIDLVVIPDIHYFPGRCKGFETQRDIIAIQTAVLNHCERMGDRFALLDVPRGLRPEAVQDYRTKFESSFGALYYPWLEVDKQGKRVLVPPCGYIAGMCSKCDRTDGVFRAPANLPLSEVTGVEIDLHEGHLGELNEKGINCIRSISQRGVRPWGARSLSSDPIWRYLTTRRVFNAVKRAIYENTQWVVFEVNGSELRREVEYMVSEFLSSLWASGYFKGENRDEAFYVQCDEENNSEEDMEQGSFVVDVGVAIGMPTEFILMSLEHRLEEQVTGL